MDVGLDKARQKHPAVEVDHPWTGARGRRHLHFGTHREDVPAAHRHCLRPGPGGIEGVDGPAAKDDGPLFIGTHPAIVIHLTSP